MSSETRFKLKTTLEFIPFALIILGWIALAALGVQQVFGPLLAILVLIVLVKLPGPVGVITCMGFACWGAHAVLKLNWGWSVLLGIPVVPLVVGGGVVALVSTLLGGLLKKKDVEDKADV